MNFNYDMDADIELMRERAYRWRAENIDKNIEKSEEEEAEEMIKELEELVDKVVSILKLDDADIYRTLKGKYYD